MNSTPRVVFPVPAVPSTSTTLPRRRPPARMSSSPAMPVLTRSRSGMVTAAFPKSRRPCAGKATVARVAVLRLSLLQQPLQRVPSIRRRTHSPEGCEPFLGRVDFEDIHPSGGPLVERPPQEAGLEKTVERPRDLRELVADVGGELLTTEPHAGVPREEEQQVEDAGVPQRSRLNE